MNATERVETVVIGAGQAGLATSYHLARRKQSHVVLEAHDKVGDVWRNRFDSLRLFTPAKYDGLPGWGCPQPSWEFPTGQQMGDYLEQYVARFELPVRTGVSVDSLSKEGDMYVVTSGHRRFEADNVVVASGTWQQPIVPAFADELDPRIRQLHSSEYRNPSQLQDGAALVVGASHSGADIALELSDNHRTFLSGAYRGEIPFDLASKRMHVILPVMWFVANHVLTERTPMGRKARHHVRGEGGPLLRVKSAHLDAAGVEHHDARTVGVQDGKPLLAEGQVLDVANIVWCTGFGKDTDWIQFPVAGEDGWPEQSRGVATSSPGLYFVGLPFLQAFASMLVGGVGRDAEFVAKHIARRPVGVHRELAGASGGRRPRGPRAP